MSAVPTCGPWVAAARGSQDSGHPRHPSFGIAGHEHKRQKIGVKLFSFWELCHTPHFRGLCSPSMAIKRSAVEEEEEEEEFIYHK